MAERGDNGNATVDGFNCDANRDPGRWQCLCRDGSLSRSLALSPFTAHAPIYSRRPLNLSLAAYESGRLTRREAGSSRQQRRRARNCRSPDSRQIAFGALAISGTARAAMDA